MTRVGADLAKRVIQVHAVDAGGKLVTNKALARDKFILWCAQLPAGCLVAMEASSSAHHWARKGAGGHHRGTASKGNPGDIRPGRHSRLRHGCAKWQSAESAGNARAAGPMAGRATLIINCYLNSS